MCRYGRRVHASFYKKKNVMNKAAKKMVKVLK